VSSPRALHVAIAIALAVGGIGLISGVRGTGQDVADFVARPRPPDAVSVARGYADMRTPASDPDATLHEAWWTMLRPVDPFAPVLQDDGDRAAARTRRASRRAYDGAPPTIPHAIDQAGTPPCLTCHEHGVAIGALRSPKMSHARHDGCVQCHVVEQAPMPGPVPPPPETTFVGLRRAGVGDRAWPGAPPTIPHPTAMRDRCDSCHGPHGLVGIKTTHPWRSSCTQCHAPSAVLDRVPSLSAP
jgi:nitrate reductase (cytochrome), electron transfer subunit